jgi:predicted metal-dependent phosphoesterase TrpH
MKYDFHSHTKYSKDGILEPRRLVEVAIKRGLSGLAVTDHNTIRGGVEAKKFETNDFEVVVGSEIKTNRGEIIGIFLNEEIMPGDFLQVLDKIKSQGGISIVPHPFDSLRKSAFFPEDADAKHFKFIEGFNARCMFGKYNSLAFEYAKKHDMKAVGGSDAHFANEVGRAGIITDKTDMRSALLGNFSVFPKRHSVGTTASCAMNHIGTTSLKVWRKWIIRRK